MSNPYFLIATYKIHCGDVYHYEVGVDGDGNLMIRYVEQGREPFEATTFDPNAGRLIAAAILKACDDMEGK